MSVGRRTSPAEVSVTLSAAGGGDAGGDDAFDIDAATVAFIQQHLTNSWKIASLHLTSAT